MEKLTTSKRAEVLRCLIEGLSIASTSRITGAAKNTIVALLENAGEACSDFQDRTLRHLPCKVIQLDEIWSFVGCKEKTKKVAKGDHPGDVWTWTCLCADTKLMVGWRIGDRDMRTGYAFCADLSDRFDHPVQITSDGHTVYPWAVRANFPDADFAQLIKIYGKDENGLDIVKSCYKERVAGNPDMSLVSTSYVERSNLTVRMTNRRFTRLTNAYSKKLANHAHMMALCFMSYNFCRKHMSLKETPAQAAGLTDHKWTLDEVVEMMDAYLVQRDADAFEKAFEAKYDTPRTQPKTYTPTPKDQIPLPWYLNPEGKSPYDTDGGEKSLDPP